MTARAEHRRLDRAALEAEARDGGLAGAPADLFRPRRFRTVDLTMSRPQEPTVTLAELWERTSARGSRYFSGFLGGCQVLMFDGGEKPHPTKPGETVHVWRLVLQERDPARRHQGPDPGDGRGRGVART